MTVLIPRRLLALLTLILCSVAVAPAMATASPITDRIGTKRAQAIRAAAEADRLGDALEPVIQRYNQATLQLDDVRERIASNRRRIGATEHNVRAGQEILADRLRRSYRSGEPDVVATVLSSGSIVDMLATADVFRRSEMQTAQLIEDMRQNRRELGIRRAQLRRDERRVDELVRELARQGVRIRASIARQQALVRGLEREIRQLEIEERRRQERLIAEARRRLVEARRAAEVERQRQATLLAAQVDPGIGGSAPAEPLAAARTELDDSGAAVAAEEPDTIAPAPPPSDGSIGVRAVQAAMRYVGTPYSWGGGNASGPSRGFAQGANTVGFDCSGLTLYAYAQVGISLSHFTGSQWNQGRRISSMSDLQAGDLVFFGSDLGHMGMYIGGGNMIHAPRTGDVVKISNITSSGYYQGRFQGGVRPY